MLFDIIGWIGSSLILVDYALLSLKKIKTGLLYQIINFLGATFMAIGLFPKNAWFSFSLEIVWGIIAINAIAKICKTKIKKM